MTNKIKKSDLEKIEIHLDLMQSQIENYLKGTSIYTIQQLEFVLYSRLEKVKELIERNEVEVQ